jgi:hypothetical protein
MVSAARRPARAGFGIAKHSATSMATDKTRPMVVAAPVFATVLFEFIRGFILCFPFKFDACLGISLDGGILVQALEK